jgi:L-iditol 2-dehydrogenase
MRAVVKAERGPGHVALHDDWPEPTVRPGWVVAEVLACGICGTDIHILNDEFRTFPPVVMGHEYVVRITELGEGVEGWAVGDRVVCEQHVSACGQCDVCRRGMIHLCREKRPPGGGIDGAFAERVALPARLLHRVPDAVSDEQAAVTEPMAICLTGIDRGEVRPGELAVVVGPGPVGLITALALRAAGLDVVLVGRQSSAARLELARSLGIEVCLDDPAEVMKRLEARSPRHGADVAFEASGSEQGLDLAIGATRRAGRVVCLGIVGAEKIAVRVDEAFYRNLDLRFSNSSEYSTWDRALALLATGAVDPTPLITPYPLEGWQQAFDDLGARRVVKAMLKPRL